MEAPVRLAIAPDPRHLRLARLTASSLAADLDYAVRDIDDLKVAIDELCAVLLVDAAGPLELAFAPGPEGLVVEGSAPTAATSEPRLHPIAAELLRRRGIDGPVEGDALARLTAHDWPGNVRELRNVLDRAVTLSPMARCFSELRIATPGLAASGGAIGADALVVRSDVAYSEAKSTLLEAFERRYLEDVFTRNDGNISATSRESGIDRKHLKVLLRRHGLLEG